jgi:hypothetical protein
MFTLVILETMIPSLPAEKLPGAKRGRLIILASLGILAVAFVRLLIKRWL